MENHLSSSPERVPQPTSRKVTYLDRKKRKRTISNPRSDSDSSIVSTSVSPPMKAPSAPSKKLKTSTDDKGQDQADVSTPGPSPKRAQRGPNEITKPPKARKTPRNQTAPLAVPLAQRADDLSHVVKRPDSSDSAKPPKAEKPSAAYPIGSGTSSKEPYNKPEDFDAFKKPESIVRKSKSKAKSVAADDDIDDNVSIADSSFSTTKTRRNESERIEYFKNQPECGKLEPRSVVCMVCDKIVNLGRKQTYAVRPWEIHRARCDKKAALAAPATPSSPEADDIKIAEPEASPPAAVSTFDPNAARRPSESDRKEFLEADKQIMELEKHRAFCNKCQKWIDLSAAQPYATGNWVKHKLRCSDAVPSNRVAAAKRKLLVVNDKQVKSFTPRKIECAFCGIAVILEGEGGFNLTSWDEHKKTCTKFIPISRSDAVNSVVFPSRFSRPPTSSASTEDTLVVDVGTPRVGPSLKRARDETEAVTQEDSRPSARTRTSSYTPPDIEPPSSVLGWFMLPFHSFVRGFKESLKDRS